MNKLHYGVLLGFTSCTTMVSVALLVGFGPLTPGGGPVSSTAKPLAEIEPRTAISAANTPGDADSLFKITQPGSYYLTGNITGVVGKHGIEIAASGVTLDLCGFDMVGVAGMGAFDGITSATNAVTNLAIVNGSVRNWGDGGIDLGTLGGTGTTRISGVRASGNAGAGIQAGVGCVITDCVARQNAGTGIRCYVSGSISSCSAIDNGGIGIVAGFYGTVSGCTAYSNGAAGISAGEGSLVADCTVAESTTDGIICGSRCLIRGNVSQFSGSGGDGAGIHAIGFDTRIEGNNCAGGGRGIQASGGSGNIIIRNTCSGNGTNWVIGATNMIGPIVVATATGGGLSGNGPFAGTLGSADPHANFSY